MYERWVRCRSGSETISYQLVEQFKSYLLAEVLGVVVQLRNFIVTVGLTDAGLWVGTAGLERLP